MNLKERLEMRGLYKKKEKLKRKERTTLLIEMGAYLEYVGIHIEDLDYSFTGHLLEFLELTKEEKAIKSIQGRAFVAVKEESKKNDELKKKKKEK